MQYHVNETDTGELVEVIDFRQLTQRELLVLCFCTRARVTRCGRRMKQKDAFFEIEWAAHRGPSIISLGPIIVIDASGESLAGAVDLVLEDLARVMKRAGASVDA